MSRTYTGVYHEVCGGTVVRHAWLERDIDGRPCGETVRYTCARCGHDVDPDAGLDASQARCQGCGEVYPIRLLRVDGRDKLVCPDCLGTADGEAAG